MVQLEKISKRYIQHWIIKNCSYQFEQGQAYAILGDNGSGKSTLLRIIAGMLSPSSGKISYNLKNQAIPEDKIYKYISYCAPGMDIIEEMTLIEFLNFHFKFKQIIEPFTTNQLISFCNLDHSKNKLIRDFSSGMRQRVKLAQAFFSQSTLLLLDEPCTNLDNDGIMLYQNWLEKWGNYEDRITIIASNDEREYPNIKQTLTMNHFK